MPGGDMARHQPDITKMKQLLKRSLTPLDEVIKRLIVYKTRQPVRSSSLSVPAGDI